MTGRPVLSGSFLPGHRPSSWRPHRRPHLQFVSDV